MIDLLAALRSGVVQLLEAGCDPALARLVAAGEVAILEPGEPWSMGSRTVMAYRAALVVSAPAYADLAASPARFDAIKRVFAQAMRTADTELTDLHIELKLPAIEQSFRVAYRAAPSPSPRERPAASAILAGAAALLDALGQEAAAALVRRAELTTAQVPGTSTPLLRCVVRLSPADLASAQRDAQLGEQVRSAVHAAATRADEAVAVELAVTLPDVG